ncbi:MAG: formylglycine-generating enzyme family protein [Bacteroidales bacterium]|nr:formylglycine-generating enzyme family protein [Bacteroidales bacterium]
MNRRNFINRTLAAGLTTFIPVDLLESFSVQTKGSKFNDDLFDNNDIIPAPDDPGLWEEWRTALQSWRKKKQSQLRYDGTSYLSDPLKWVSSNFSCCFVMICDSDFYDYKANVYRISELIKRGKNEYGGYDSVVLWHAYPRIGLDERNQFDFYREMPHGLPGIKGVIEQFHQADIKVFIGYNPWDKGTRREQKPDIDLLIELLRSIGADGIFLDTMKDAPGFREKLDEVKPGIVLEGEIALPLDHIQTHHMSWAQWFSDSKVPGIYRNKWFERHHMQHAIARWSADRNPQLQTAWMNGSGILIWENVFGQLLGWNEKDKSTLRCISSIQRRYKDLFSGENWIPLSDRSSTDGVYISSWGNNDLKIRTLVNRLDSNFTGELFRTKYNQMLRWFDLVSGEELHPETVKSLLSIKGSIAPRGIACILSVLRSRVDKDLMDFLAFQKGLQDYSSAETKEIVVQIAAVKTSIANVRPKKLTGMNVIPGVSINIKTEYRFREPGGYGNIQNHLKLADKQPLHSSYFTEKQTDIKKYAIDRTPVTNMQFLDFMNKSGYKPAVSENFLKHWKDGGIPSGKENHPVVYVDITDALAYAKWAGKRLPVEEEWQFAAQGVKEFIYPWGNTMEPDKCNPNLNGETTDVNAFPAGKSSFGCLDMCGNVWELTGRIYSDGRTRFVMLKGGSCYKAEGSEWYFDGGPQKNSYVAKMLLIWPGLDRCSTVGFRCAADL